jgi:hypothetical protein
MHSQPHALNAILRLRERASRVRFAQDERLGAQTTSLTRREVQLPMRSPNSGCALPTPDALSQLPFQRASDTLVLAVLEPFRIRGSTAIGLLCLLLSVFGCSCRPLRTPTRGKTEVSLHAGYYLDNDHTTVASPSIRARVPVTERITATGSYGVDIIAAASVDVVASASRMTDQRHQSTLGAQMALSDRSAVQATFYDSRENDYISDGLTLAFDHETPSKSTALHLEARGRYDQVGPGWQLSRPGTLYATTAAGSVTQVVDRYTLFRFALQTDVLYGFQSSVYRYVSMAEGRYSERIPDLRVRTAAMARIQRSLVPSLAVYLEYDLTVDNWGVIAHAVDLGVRWDALPWLVVEARNRVFVQSAATFYQSYYDSVVTYRTRDRMLGGLKAFWPQLGIRMRFPPWPSPNDWEVGLSIGMLSQIFDDFLPLSQRQALLMETWIGRRF